MKKFLCLVLVLVIATGTVAFAEGGEMEKILRIVKERIPSTEEYSRLDSRTTVDGLGETSYRFNWIKEDDENYAEMSVAITQSGIVKSYNKYHYEKRVEEKASVNRKTTAEVLPVAEEFLKKINPDIYRNLKIEPAGEFENLYADSYSYRIERFENGIPVHGDGGNITVSKEGTEVESFYLQYTEGLEFESAKNLISQEDAKAAFAKEFGLKLYYTAKYDKGERTVALVYDTDMPYSSYISAQNGRVVTQVEPVNTNNKFLADAEESAKNDMVTSGASGFTEAEKAELENVAGLISKEQAAEKIFKSPVLKLSEKYVPEYYSLNKDYYDAAKYYWIINFRGNGVYANARVDAADGRIINFNRDRRYYEDEEKIAPNMAKKIADTTFATLAPEYYSADNSGKYVADPYEEGYMFTWTRHENGIPYYEDGVYIEIDEVTGDVVGYNFSYSNIEFPSPEGILNEQAATQKLFEQVDYSPAYVKTCKSENSVTYDKAMVVYSFANGSRVINSTDGKLFYNYSNEDSELLPYDDISGHFAENAAETLRKYGVGFTGGKFMPDGVITQRDLVALLTSIFYRGGAIVLGENYDYDAVYAKAKHNGILDDEEYLPESPVTREMAAVMIVRAIGFDEAASLEGIYKCPFADVTEKQGHISILYAMGVFRGDENGNFNPENTLTRGEIAVVLMNYLTR